MAIDSDPKRMIYAVVENLRFIPLPTGHHIYRDNEATDASIGVLWEKGPETLKHLFFTVGYDVVVTLGDPITRSDRPIQDKPIHYQMRYPVTVTSVNKTGTAAQICSGPRMQYKVTYELRYLVEANAQPAGLPHRTIRIVTDSAKHKRVGGIDIWEAVHIIEYETSYGWY